MWLIAMAPWICGADGGLVGARTGSGAMPFVMPAWGASPEEVLRAYPRAVHPLMAEGRETDALEQAVDVQAFGVTFDVATFWFREGKLRSARFGHRRAKGSSTSQMYQLVEAELQAKYGDAGRAQPCRTERRLADGFLVHVPFVLELHPLDQPPKEPRWSATDCLPPGSTVK
ncbi:MAG TPA: hypothetical protein VFA20_30495 [Myxococcaceae bacterium]|nr:hypothetical protein [Myxococcaceae bacterium]